MRNIDRLITVITVVLSLTACRMSTLPERPEVHGHRGCRALLPENTVAGFLKAAELGSDWLEMDVVISGDGEVIVSHEPWMDHRICLDPEGNPISSAEERSFNLYRMSTDAIRGFDCGSLRHPDFPDQTTSVQHKPTLSEVVEAVEQAAMMNGWGVAGYNIEIKSEPELYGTMQPEPEEFVRMVLDKVYALGIAERCLLQSFDPAVLDAVREQAADIPVALLVENNTGVEANLARLRTTPEYYSLRYDMMDAPTVATLRERNIEPLVWTVNGDADLRRMIALGVNGIITDHPERLIAILDEDY